MDPQPRKNPFFEGKILSSRVYPEFFALHPSWRVLNAGFGDGPQAVVYRGAFASMVGVEFQADRAARAREMCVDRGISNVEIVVGSVEQMPLPDASFDAAIAIDIIEHVEHPEVFVRELYRTLKPGGRLLITFPAMHDRFEDLMTAIGRVLKPWKKRAPHSDTWHPDHHAHEYPIAEWRRIVESAGFRFVASRATTMFPPLHLYGIPRVWFTWEWLHAIDRWFASVSWLQNGGQTVMAIFEKPTP